MKKSVIIISLFLLGATFSAKSQEITQKEKSSYAIGAILGEKIKSTGIDIATIESIKEKIDFESIKEGIRDVLKGECKLSKEEIEANLAELQKKIEYYKKLIEGMQNKESGCKQNEKNQEKIEEKQNEKSE